MAEQEKPEPAKRGPDAERLRIEPERGEDWQDALRKAIRKPTPKGGWPAREDWRDGKKRGEKPPEG